MQLELDHFFILASPGAPEADKLLDIGLQEGASNTHEGQGTANRRFFLPNTCIEFLYIDNVAEAVNGKGKKLKLLERAIHAEGSPFGLVVRTVPERTTPTFPAWKYYPRYFPDTLCFYVGDNSDNFDEPLCICMPPALPKPKKAPEPNNSGWSLTELQVSIPASKPSPVLDTFATCPGLSVRTNEDHRLWVVLNNARKGESLSLMPELPLVIEW